MTGKTIARNGAIGLAVLVAGLLLTTVIVVQTDWFRNYVRQKIITATEASTGGTVEIGKFDFDVWHLRAVVTGFVIHGNEPRDADPFVQAGRVQLDLRLFTSIKHLLDVSYLGIDKPGVNIISYADGRTNVPSPRQKSTSNTTTLETVVDLAVGHFEVTHGVIALNAQKQAIDLKANNLRAELWYNLVTQGYQGQMALDPVYVVSGRNTPVNLRVTLPVTLLRDRIELNNASIDTALSSIKINGSLENLRNPKTSARINGHIAFSDLKNAGNLPLALNAKNVPSGMDLAANATIANDTIQVNGLRLTAGQSDIEASGTLKDPKGNGSLQFKTQLALGELGRLANVSARPDGIVHLNGNAKLDQNNNYDVTGNLEARNLSVEQGKQRFSNINLLSAIHVDPHHIEANGLHLSAFGGEFAGDASLADFAKYKLNGSLNNLDIQSAARAAGVKSIPYDGIVSGPIRAEGDLKAPGTKGIVADARLSIKPGRRGIPVSGRLNARYNGATDNVEVENSYLALPHSRLNLSGALGKRLNIALTSRDLNDLLAAAQLQGKPPVVLNGGEASFTGTVTGALSAPQVAGHLAVDRFSVEGRQFNTLAADVSASPSGAAIRNGNLTRGMMNAQFSASAGLRNWSPLPREPLTADVAVNNGDLADVMVLARQPAAGYSGALSATAHINGTIGNPQGTAAVQAANGTLDGEPFSNAGIQARLADQLVTVPAAFVTTPAGRVDLTAEFQHPRDSFSTGHLHAHVQSGGIDLARVQTLQKQQPNTGGAVRLNADVTGNLSQVKVKGVDQTEFLLASVNADASAKGIRFEGQNYGDLNASARTNGQSVTYNATSDFAGSNMQVRGTTQLTAGYPTNADANISGLPIERLLVLAKQSDIPARGKLSGTFHVSGPIANPLGDANFDLANAVVYDEPIDHLRGKIDYLAQTVNVQQLELIAGPSRIDLSAKYDHPAGDLQSGKLQFQVNSNRIDLTKIRNVQKMRPGLGGIFELATSGVATVKPPSKNPSDTRVLFSDLNAKIQATGITAQGKNLGDLKLTADTSAGRLNFALDSDLAGSSIHGSGNAQLAGDYPVNARLVFSNVAYTRLQTLLGPSTGQPPSFEASTDGQLTVEGPATDVNRLSGSLQLTKLQLNTIPAPNTGRPITIQNQGPISLALDRGSVRVESAHLVGPQTDINAGGTVALQPLAFNLTVNANANLGLLQNFDRNIYSAGTVVLATTVHGTPSQPLINGQLQLRNAGFNYPGIPNGISNANGVVIFNGTSATVRDLTAESGGGKVSMRGFVGFADTLRFGLRAGATNVRVRVQQGISVNADADIRLTGTTQNSLVSGTLTIDQITYAPQSDIGSLLSHAAPPVQAPDTPSPLTENMKLDIRVRTSPSLAVQASLAQNLQATADLRVRGTASQPAVLGRVTISEGQLVFFGSTYNVNSGTISFYNPVRIEPILNVSLETQAKGVDVVLTVTGPIDNMKLSYTSDPPLQFQEIVQLLASGKTPVSDPTLLASQPSQPAQSYQQMGESAIVSKALADPISSRLERVFGVTQLKIDPAFTSGSQLPTAQLSLQQQITNNVTFTYSSALNDPNGTIVRVEWSFTPTVSLIATRDQNGIFSVNMYYKKQFR